MIGNVSVHYSIKNTVKLVLTGYFFLALVAALPLVLSGCCGWMDAYFEGLSLVTLSGATCLTALEQLPEWLLLWRSGFAWASGLGTLLLFLFVLPRLSRNTSFIFNEEYSGYGSSRSLVGKERALFFVSSSYILLTILVLMGLMVSGLPGREAFHYALGVVSTSGVRIQDGLVVTDLPLLAKWIMSMGMFLAGCNYAFVFYCCCNGLRELRRNTEFKVYAGLAVFFSALLWLNLNFGYFSGEELVEVVFQCCSFLSTTGYCVTNVNLWPIMAHVVFWFCLFLGGCAGGCAGGFKVCRIVLMAKQANRDVLKVFQPGLVDKITINQHFVSPNSLANVSFFFVAYIALMFIVAMFLAPYNFSAVDALTTASACLSNTGVVFSASHVAGNFAMLAVPGKLGVMLGMLAGRLEIFMVMLLLLPEFWRNKGNW